MDWFLEFMGLSAVVIVGVFIFLTLLGVSIKFITDLIYGKDTPDAQSARESWLTQILVILSFIFMFIFYWS